MKTFKEMVLQEAIGGDIKKIEKQYKELKAKVGDKYNISYSKMGLTVFDGKKYVCVIQPDRELKDMLSDIKTAIKNKGVVTNVGDQGIDWSKQSSKDGWTGD